METRASSAAQELASIVAATAAANAPEQFSPDNSILSRRRWSKGEAQKEGESGPVSPPPLEEAASDTANGTATGQLSEWAVAIDPESKRRWWLTGDEL